VPIRKYLFSDESGDPQCIASPNVSKYFAVGTLLLDEPQLRQLRSVMSTLRDELAWRSHGLDQHFTRPPTNSMSFANFMGPFELSFATVMGPPGCQ
jgi:hypothetical protein